MRRDLDLVRQILLEAEKSERRYFFIGEWQWTDHDMRDQSLSTELSEAKLFHLDLMEQGGLIRKSQPDEMPEHLYWEITWLGFDFLDATRSEKLWSRLKAEAVKQGVSLTVQSAISALKTITTEILSVGMAQ